MIKSSNLHYGLFQFKANQWTEIEDRLIQHRIILSHEDGEDPIPNLKRILKQLGCTHIRVKKLCTYGRVVPDAILDEQKRKQAAKKAAITRSEHKKKVVRRKG